MEEILGDTEPGLEDLNFENYVSRVNSRLENPLDDLMRYAAGEIETRESEEFSYADFAEKTPYSSDANDVSYLIETGFLDLEFFTTERLDSESESRKIIFSSEKQAIADNLAEINHGLKGSESKLAMPGIEDAVLSIGEIGQKYISKTELDYSGEQAVEAYNRSCPTRVEPRDSL